MEYTIDKYKEIYKQKQLEAKQSQEAYNKYVMEATVVLKTLNTQIRALLDSGVPLDITPLEEDISKITPEQMKVLYEKVETYRKEIEAKIQKVLGITEENTDIADGTNANPGVNFEDADSGFNFGEEEDSSMFSNGMEGFNK